MSKQSDLVSVSQGSGGDPLYIDTTNDNVGIGTSSPSNFSGYTTLDVVNASNGGAILARGSTVEARFVADDPTGTVQVKAQSSHPLTFGTSGTERMRIDSAGRVTMPYQPAFMAVGLNTTVPSTTDTQLRFDTTNFNVGSHYSTSTYRFTAPVAGVYYFHCQARLAGVSGNGRYDMVFRKNGTGAMGGGQNQQGSNDSGFNVSAFLSLAANDYVDVVINQNNGSSLTTNNSLNTSQGGGTAATHFFGYLVS